MLAPGNPSCYVVVLVSARLMSLRPCVGPPRVSVVSSRQAFRVIGNVLSMYMADRTGASSGGDRPCFARLADDLTSLACGVMLTQVQTLSGMSCNRLGPSVVKVSRCLRHRFNPKPCGFPPVIISMLVT